MLLDPVQPRSGSLKERIACVECGKLVVLVDQEDIKDTSETVAGVCKNCANRDGYLMISLSAASAVQTWLNHNVKLEGPDTGLHVTCESDGERLILHAHKEKL